MRSGSRRSGISSSTSLTRTATAATSAASPISVVGEEATVAVSVRSTAVRPMRNRRQKRVEARVFDDSGPLVAVWFNQPWIARELSEGTHVLLHGKLRQRNQFWVDRARAARERERSAAHGRARPGLSRHPGHHADEACASS